MPDLYRCGRGLHHRPPRGGWRPSPRTHYLRGDAGTGQHALQGAATRKDRAKDGPHKPITLLGYGEGHAYEHISQAKNLTTSAAVQSGQSAYAEAGLSPDDISLLQLYDCFTPALLIQIEDLGPRNDNTWGSWWYENSIGGFKKPIFAGHQNCNDQIRRLARELYDAGKIHCHRDYGLGTQAINLRYVWLDTIVPIPDIDDLPFVKAAWEDLYL